MKTLCGVLVGNMKDPDPETRGRVALVDLPFPALGPQDVRIKVAYCAICGSDPHCVDGCFGQPKDPRSLSRWGTRYRAWLWNWGRRRTTKA